MVTGETMMPIPGGEITSTETWNQVPAVTDEAILAADAEEAVEEYVFDPDVDDPYEKDQA
jgi:hypothetical protein